MKRWVENEHQVIAKFRLLEKLDEMIKEEGDGKPACFGHPLYGADGSNLAFDVATLTGVTVSGWRTRSKMNCECGGKLWATRFYREPWGFRVRYTCQKCGEKTWGEERVG